MFAFLITTNLKSYTKNNIKIFILIKRHNKQIEWWRIDQSSLEHLDQYCDPDCPEIKLYNFSGGWNCISTSDTVLETVEGEDWDVIELLKHRKKTSSYKTLKRNSKKKELKCGWLSPSGEMHYCEYHDHISYVHEILGSDVPTIEKKGWVHVLRGEGEPYFYSKKRITQDQARILREELKIHVFEDQILYQ